jgi:hypothetical protein
MIGKKIDILISLWYSRAIKGGKEITWTNRQRNIWKENYWGW